MTQQYAPTAEGEVAINAGPPAVYALITDLRRSQCRPHQGHAATPEGQGRELSPNLSDPPRILALDPTRGDGFMCWMCDHPGSTIDDYLDHLRETVIEHGWATQYVADDRTPYAYTIGLHEFGLPELLVTGVSPQRAARVLNTAARIALRDDAPMPGSRIQLPAGPLIEVVAVDHPDAHMNMAVAIYGPELRALQLVWADGRGRWPWAAGFSDGHGRQPVFGMRAA